MVSALLIWQIASLFAAELAAPPCSPLERDFAATFGRYYELTDQGTSHRFYWEIGPTPVLLAELRFGDGRPTKTIRIPDRSVRPRIVYQRQLALANAVFDEFAPALANPEIDRESRWARAFARHLCLTNPGCQGVKIRLQMHRNPEPDQLIHAMTEPGERPINPDDEEFYDPPRLIGDFPCETP